MLSCQLPSAAARHRRSSTGLEFRQPGFHHLLPLDTHSLSMFIKWDGQQYIGHKFVTGVRRIDARRSFVNHEVTDWYLLPAVVFFHRGIPEKMLVVRILVSKRIVYLLLYMSNCGSFLVPITSLFFPSIFRTVYFLQYIFNDPFYVPDCLQGVGDRAVNKTNKFLFCLRH